MIGKTKNPSLDKVIEEMKRRGLDTEGVTTVSPRRGPERWVVKDECVIGTYNARSHELIMTEDVLRGKNN